MRSCHRCRPCGPRAEAPEGHAVACSGRRAFGVRRGSILERLRLRCRISRRHGRRRKATLSGRRRWPASPSSADSSAATCPMPTSLNMVRTAWTAPARIGSWLARAGPASRARRCVSPWTSCSPRRRPCRPSPASRTGAAWCCARCSAREPCRRSSCRTPTRGRTHPWCSIASASNRRGRAISSSSAGAWRRANGGASVGRSCARSRAARRALLRDLALGSIGLSALALAPILIVQLLAQRVLLYRTSSTLAILCLALGAIIATETVLGAVRRFLLTRLAARTDARLATTLFDRLLSMPLPARERFPRGALTHRIEALGRLRAAVTGDLLGTALDAGVLVFFLPVMAFLSPAITVAVVLGLIVIGAGVAFALPRVDALVGAVLAAEEQRAAFQTQAIMGAKTIKSLGLPGGQRRRWRQLSGEVARRRLDLAGLAGRIDGLADPCRARPAVRFAGARRLSVGHGRADRRRRHARRLLSAGPAPARARPGRGAAAGSRHGPAPGYGLPRRRGRPARQRPPPCPVGSRGDTRRGDFRGREFPLPRHDPPRAAGRILRLSRRFDPRHHGAERIGQVDRDAPAQPASRPTTGGPSRSTASISAISTRCCCAAR